jgi:predicted dehydrogenase
VNIAIIGCGYIGQKRASVLSGADLVACSDIDPRRAEALARKYKGAEAVVDWRTAVKLSDIDMVIVSTTHDSLADVTLEAINAEKNVLVEKPAARSIAEIKPVIYAAEKKGVQVRVGFNHRYHPALIKAKEIVASGQMGPLMFIRARYGHGGRIGYDKEWRAKPELSGGGELIDQGPHLIDLSRWFLGEFAEVQGFAHTYYWDMPVDDNGFMLLKTEKQQVAFLHASCTEWKNMFSFEIYGKNAKLHIEGLGGSYGVERLSYYRMLPEMGPPETTIWEYPRGDDSWRLEFEEFLEDIRLNRTPSANLKDAMAVLTIVENIYKESGYDYYT